MLSQHSKNMIWVFGGDTGSKVLGFMATVYLARVIGEEGFGIINIGLAVLAYGMVFVSGGIPLLGTQMIARSGSGMGELAGNLVKLRMLLAVMTLGLITVVAAVLVSSGTLFLTISIFCLSLLPVSLMVDWYFKGKGQMGVVAIGRIIQTLIYLSFILLVVKASTDVVLVAWAWTVAGLGSAGWIWWQFRRKNYPIRFSKGFKKLGALWKKSLPLGLAGIISQVALQLPFLYLGWRNNNAAAGQFGVAFRLMMALLVMDRIFNSVFFPEISRQASHPFHYLSKGLQTITKSITMVVIAAGSAGVLLAPWLIPAIFSDTYRASIPLFQILVGYFTCSFFNSIMGYTLIALGHYRKFTRAYAIAFAFFLITLFPLSQWFSLSGISLALVLYQLTALIFNTVQLGRILPIDWLRAMLLPILTAAAVVAGIITWVDWHPVFQCLLALLVGLPLGILAAGFTRDDGRFIRKALL